MPLPFKIASSLQIISLKQHRQARELLHRLKKKSIVYYINNDNLTDENALFKLHFLYYKNINTPPENPNIPFFKGLFNKAAFCKEEKLHAEEIIYGKFEGIEKPGFKYHNQVYPNIFELLKDTLHASEHLLQQDIVACFLNSVDLEFEKNNRLFAKHSVWGLRRTTDITTNDDDSELYAWEVMAMLHYNINHELTLAYIKALEMKLDPIICKSNMPDIEYFKESCFDLHEDILLSTPDAFGGCALSTFTNVSLKAVYYDAVVKYVTKQASIDKPVPSLKELCFRSITNIPELSEYLNLPKELKDDCSFDRECNRKYRII